jgi:hypothetical protein
MVSSRPKHNFIEQKVYFSLLMQVCIGLIMLAGCTYLTQVSLLLIGQQGLVDFFRYRPLHPFGWQIVQILRQRRRKTTNTAPTTLSAIQAASQSTFISYQLYSTCDLQD